MPKRDRERPNPDRAPEPAVRFGMSRLALGLPAPSTLTPARIELHWAAQVIAAAGDGWLARREDDSHTAMTWEHEHRAMRGERLDTGASVALRVADLTVVVERDGAEPDELALRGRTLAEAMAWTDARLAAGGAMRGIHARDYDMPEHALRTGATFAADPDALAELGRWYDAAIDVLRAELPAAAAAALRIWPHHFDLGAILFLQAGAAAERAPQIGIGLSPGDGYYAEPYYYVTPYPIVEGAVFPPLAGGGHWRREGFTGAILTGTTLLATTDAAAQEAQARTFIASALAGARAVMSGPT